MEQDVFSVMVEALKIVLASIDIQFFAWAMAVYIALALALHLLRRMKGVLDKADEALEQQPAPRPRRSPILVVSRARRRDPNHPVID